MLLAGQTFSTARHAPLRWLAAHRQMALRPDSWSLQDTTIISTSSRKARCAYDSRQIGFVRDFRRPLTVVSGGIKQHLNDPNAIYLRGAEMPASVIFAPPLFQQRRRQILSDLAKNDAQNILEVGCADAPIIKAVLSQPTWAETSPEWRAAFSAQTGIAEHPLLAGDNVSPRVYTAIDIDEETLPLAVDAVAKKHQEESKAAQRYDALRVQLIHGSLLDDHSRVTGAVDAIVACEVIEHLDEPVLERFAQAMLGTYAPRVMIVTTPNFAFNVNFTEQQGRKQYHDPTGRTNRVFRHHDHKFEWTPQELRAWCEGVCTKYPYSFQITGVGPGKRRQSDKKLAPVVVTDEDARYASQHVVFTRRTGVDNNVAGALADTKRLSLAPAQPFEGFVKDGVTVFDFPTTAKSSDATREDIIAETRNAIMYTGTTVTEDESADNAGTMYESELSDLWKDESLRQICDGRLETWLPIESGILDVFKGSGITNAIREGKVYLRYASQYD